MIERNAMASTVNMSVEEQISLLAALQLPRTVRSSQSIRVVTLILGLAALGSLALVGKALSHRPRDFAPIAGEFVWMTVFIGVGVQVYVTPRVRNLLRRGYPTLGRVLNAERRGNATRIKYSYQLASGIVMQGELMASRKRDLLKGTSVVVFYDPKVPEYSSILGCKLWDVEFPSSQTGSS